MIADVPMCVLKEGNFAAARAANAKDCDAKVVEMLVLSEIRS